MLCGSQFESRHPLVDEGRKPVVVNLGHNVFHNCVDVKIVFCGCLEVVHIIEACHFPSIALANPSIFSSIYFVAHEHFSYVRVNMLVNRLKPTFDVLKRIRISDVKTHYYTLGLLVKTDIQCTEPFLPSRVP